MSLKRIIQTRHCEEQICRALVFSVQNCSFLFEESSAYKMFHRENCNSSVGKGGASEEAKVHSSVKSCLQSDCEGAPYELICCWAFFPELLHQKLLRFFYAKVIHKSVYQKYCLVRWRYYCRLYLECYDGLRWKLYSFTTTLSCKYVDSATQAIPTQMLACLLSSQRRRKQEKPHLLSGLTTKLSSC